MNTVFHDDALKIPVKQCVQGHILFLMEDLSISLISSSASSVAASVETATVIKTEALRVQRL